MHYSTCRCARHVIILLSPLPIFASANSIRFMRSLLHRNYQEKERERERGGGKEYRALVVAKYAHSARICSVTLERALGRACNLLKTRLFRHITSVSATFDTDGQPARYFTDDPPLERPFKTSARNVRLTHGACLLGGGELDRR